MKLALASLGLLGVAHAEHYTYAATFGGDNGINGTVTVDNGYIFVDLDLSDEPNLPGGYSTCVTGGMKYHIHTKWTHSDSDDKINGTDCGSGYTGGHYDPWAGCGSATGNSYCGSTLDNGSLCLPKTSYSADFDNDVFSAEVGDWNGKYGLATVDGSNMMAFNDSSFFEVTPEDVFNMSVVFHCNGGSRAFCAPFVETTDNVSMDIPDQNTTNAAYASFDAFSTDSVAIMYPNGDVYLEMDASDEWTAANTASGCSEYEVGIFEAGTTWAESANSSNSNATCASYVGDFYDPTHQCPDFSGSPWCSSEGYLCDDSDYAYDCDYDNDRYSCAPGDLSGKGGAMDSDSWLMYAEGPDTLIPPTDDMEGMYLAYYCTDSDDAIYFLACAPIYSVSTDITFPTPAPTVPTFDPTEVPSAQPTDVPNDSSDDDDHTYVATFGGDNGITGTVTVDNGYIAIDLNMSSMPTGIISTGNFTECVAGGMKYHIHESWDWSYTEDKVLADCGSGYTGGHWDPWHACGSASGNDYCDYSGGYPDTCLATADYSASFSTDPFSAEVGDWNGKYGLLSLDSDYQASRTDSSFWEVIGSEVSGRSIVFHCNGGSRAFCAGFEETTTDASNTIPDQDISTTTSVTAEFDLLSDDSSVTLSATGEVSIDLDWSDITDSTGCDTFFYGVFEAGDTALSSSAVGTDCDDVVGDFYDPTHQCPDFSGSAYCTAGKVCNATAYSYDCDWDDNRYSCAPGDFSGKWGDITASDETFTLSESGPGTLIPEMGALEDLIFAVYCGNDTTVISYLACAPFDAVTTTETPDDSGAFVQSLVMVVLSVAAMMF